MSRFTVQTTICLSASAVLMVMTELSATHTSRLNYEIATGIFCAVFCLVPILLNRLRIMTVPATLVLISIVSVFFHAYGVLLMRYDLVRTWDIFTHTTSSVVVSLCAFYALLCIDRFDKGMRTSPLMMHVYIILITMTFSVVWEVFELLADNIWSIHMQYSPWDTVKDFGCDALGALIIVAYAGLFYRYRDPDELIEDLDLHPGLVRYLEAHSDAGQDA
ncbi:MAG: hypothetical protein GXX87_03485 [Euryarchaeota archaeon]|jgi:hypothetical protein|nr:hypothetical protein [Euryarchaeota archaeon]